jgi:3-oxoadipate enol-lactonase
MPHLRINQMDLHYEETGNGPALLFIHGLGSTGQDWEPQIRKFSAAYRVITFDLRGHGTTGKPSGPYSIPLFAGDATELLKALKIGAAHVVGLSLGGCVAFQLALDRPELVRSLVVVNSAPEFIRRSFKTWLETWRRTAIVRWRGLRRMGERIGARLLPRPEHAVLRATFVARFAKNDPQAYLNSLKALIGWSVTDRLGSIRCPVLVVSSEHDYTALAFKEKYARKIPDARLVVIPDAHHAAPQEEPDKFNAVLAEFLAAQGDPGQPRA